MPCSAPSFSAPFREASTISGWEQAGLPLYKWDFVQPQCNDSRLTFTPLVQSWEQPSPKCCTIAVLQAPSFIPFAPKTQTDCGRSFGCSKNVNQRARARERECVCVFGNAFVHL